MLALAAFAVLQIAATPSLTAQRSDISRLVARTRAARYHQDSALAMYEAIARQRVSASIGVARGLGIGPVGRERLAARFESVARVGWHHELGAFAELIGSRAVVPIVGEIEQNPEDGSQALALPYYPGRDRLWPMSEFRQAMPNAQDWIAHPLDEGADSLYMFSGGDSLSYRLPDGAIIRLREIRVRPRRPESRLIVGSLWVDAATGSLVRAAYRPSVPMDLWPFISQEMDRDDQDRTRRFGPYSGIVREVIVEHGLYEGRFWLPRTRVVYAEGTAKGARVTASIEQSFRYEKVAALPPDLRSRAFLAVPEPVLDPRSGRVRRPKWHGVEERTDRCRSRDDPVSRWSADSLLRDPDLTIMYADGVRFRVLVPCNRNDLATSPELPPSIYDGGEELFTDTDLQALRKDVEGALALGSQAEWSPQPVSIEYGVERGLLRYNRIEGFSAGILAERVLGRGYSASALARVGLADLEPNAELALERSNVRSLIRGTVYRRLVAVNDWGSPLGIGASVNALLFAKDEGFYHRAFGAEVQGTVQRMISSPMLSWRLFAERQDSASVETQASLARTFSNRRFAPNIGAVEGTFYGGAANLAFNVGLDPRGTRLSGALRAEGASHDGTSTYGRFLTELTVVRGLGRGVQATGIASVGSSVGTLPLQRMYLLGGAHTVRGHRAATAVGDAYWMGRAELARGHPLVRPSIFGDIGWAGSRDSILTSYAPLAGAGFGAAMLDGLIRLDFARGLTGERRWRVDFYLEVR